LPEPEVLTGHGGALRVLHDVLGAVQALLRGEAIAPVTLSGLPSADLQLINQVLGEGEVSAQVLAQPEVRSFENPEVRLRVQESVFAGIWRVLEIDDAGLAHDRIEVGAIPAALRRAAQQDAARARPPLSPVPAHVINVPTILTELADLRAQWHPGTMAHVVNLTLLPLSPEDIGHIDHQLGTGRVLILSRGYGNCRITNTCVAHTWRVVYYNSQDAVILNSIEVTDLPDVACAAPEDLSDTQERLADVLQWVEQA
jgi:hydrogenase-1 operon protein HyaF